MRKNIIIIFLILIMISFCVVSFATTSTSKMNTDVREQKNGVNYTFGDNVNVRNKPGLDEKVIFQLDIGQKIDILIKTNVHTTINNRKEFWYRIEANNKTGYIWGGLIADAFVEVDLDYDNKKELILVKDLTIEDVSIQNNNENSIGYSIKIVRDNKLLDEYEKELRTIMEKTTPIKIKIFDDPNFSPRVKLFQIDAYVRAEIEYGFHQVDYYFLKDDDIAFAFSPPIAGCDPPYCVEVFIIFPDDFGGVPNTIKVITHDFNLDMHDTRDDDNFYIYYIEWNGDTFSEKRYY